MMKREVVPEILDELEPDHPDAIRARTDLRRINFLMGNHRWLRHRLSCFEGDAIVELGAGDGELLRSLAILPARLAGLDLAPRPGNLADEIDWIAGDLFETLPIFLERSDDTTTAIVANLFLHHFEPDRLEVLGHLINSRSVTRLCFSEPYRSRLALVESSLLLPFVNRVTRHDMPVSIRAGFRPGELPPLLQLDPATWQIRETVSALGGCRLEATRNP